jgi:hypothetical protein
MRQELAIGVNKGFLSQFPVLEGSLEIEEFGFDSDLIILRHAQVRQFAEADYAPLRVPSFHRHILRETWMGAQIKAALGSVEAPVQDVFRFVLAHLDGHLHLMHDGGYANILFAQGVQGPLSVEVVDEMAFLRMTFRRIEDPCVWHPNRYVFTPQ